MKFSEQSKHYKCQNCGKIFSSHDSVNLQCSHCGAHQRDLTKDSHVEFTKIATQSIPLDTKQTIDPKIQREEDRINAKLDVVGSKKNFRTLIAILICCGWATLMVGITYKVIVRDRNQKVSITTSQDGSLTKVQQLQWQKNGAICNEILKEFLSSEDFIKKEKILYAPNIDIVEDLFNTPTIKLPTRLKPGAFIVHMPTENILVLHTTSVEDDKIEAVFYKKEDQWLIDWRHFFNYSSINFSDYLVRQPLGNHQFRLFFSSSDSGDNILITFYDTQQNNSLYNLPLADKQSLLIEGNNKFRDQLDTTIEKAKLYKDLNKTLTDIEEGLLGTRDPNKSIYRATVTFNYRLENGRKILQLQSIDKLHWLDDYYLEQMTPAQKYTYERR